MKILVKFTQKIKMHIKTLIFILILIFPWGREYCFISLFCDFCSCFHSCHCLWIFSGIIRYFSISPCLSASSYNRFLLLLLSHAFSSSSWPTFLHFLYSISHFSLLLSASLSSSSPVLVFLSSVFLSCLCSVSSSSLSPLLFHLPFHLLTCFRPLLLFPSWVFLWPTFPSPLRLHFLVGRWELIL